MHQAIAVQNGFAIGGNSPDTQHFKIVSYTEIAKGVMRRQQYPAVFGNLSQSIVGVNIKRRGLLHKNGCVLFNTNARFGEESGQTVNNGGGTLCPNARIHPYMWIEPALIVSMRDHQGPIQRVGNRMDGALAVKIFEKRLHLRFEVRTVPKGGIGPRHRHDITAGLAVAVWIDTGTHQPSDRNGVATNPARHIRDHSSRREDVEAVRSQSRDRGECGKTRQESTTKSENMSVCWHAVLNMRAILKSQYNCEALATLPDQTHIFIDFENNYGTFFQSQPKLAS